MAFRKSKEERAAYLKSKRFRALSGASWLLLIAGWFSRWHGLLLVYLALILSIIAVAPIYPSFSEIRNRRIEAPSKASRILLAIVLLALIAIIGLAIFGIIESRRSLQP